MASATPAQEEVAVAVLVSVPVLVRVWRLRQLGMA